MLYANKKTTIHSIIFILCIIGYLVSPKMDIQEPIQQVSATEISEENNETKSWVQSKAKEVVGKLDTPVQDTKQVKSDTKDVKVECNADCKVKTLVSLGYNERIAWSLVYTCKEKAKDPRHCIIIGASILKAESWGGNKCYKNGCFGILAGGISYKTLESWVEDWVTRYTKYWYKQPNPSGFYSNSPTWKPKTHYCMSEHQPNWTTLSYCPNWHKHAWSAFNEISAKF